MAGETETVTLNLDGSFASSASAAASSAWKLSDSIKVMEKSAEMAAQKMAKLRSAAKAAAGLGDGVAKGFGGSIPTALQSSLSQGGFAKIVGGVGKLFGDNAAAGLVSGAAKLTEVSDKMAPYAPLLGVAGNLVGAGGAIVAKAAVALTASAVALTASATAILAAGVKFGIETTDKASIQRAIFGQLGKGGGYEMAIKIAGDYGLNTEEAFAKVKGLLGAKFAEKDIPAFVKIAVGIDAVKGEGKGKAFLEKLENTANKGGKANEEAIKGFAEAGLNVDDIWKAIAQKLGTTVAVAQSKVKSGAVSMRDALDAVKKVGEKQFGQIADKMGGSVEALIGKIKIQLAQMFSNLDLKPVKSALKAIVDALSGPTGKELGKGISELFSSIVGLLKGITAKDVKGFLVPIVDMVKDLAATIKANAPGLKAFGRAFAETSVDGLKLVVTLLKGAVRIAAVVGQVWSGVRDLIAGGPDTGKLRKVPTLLDQVRTAVQMMFSPLQTAQRIWQNFQTMFTGGSAKVGASARAAGTAVASGFAGGIMAGLAGAVAAAGRMASAALAKIRAVLGVASPAKALVFVGDMMAGGMAKGMNDNADKPAKAAGKMAAGAAGAAAGGAGGGRGGAAAGGGAPVFNITINAAPGMGAAEARALGGAAVEGAYEAWKKNARRFEREQQEGRAA
jgi:hypothetical protein